MHDILLAKEIFDAVIKCAKKNKLKRVAKVTIGLGRIEEHHETVKPENLKFNFRIFSKDSVASKAILIIKKMKLAPQAGERSPVPKIGNKSLNQRSSGAWIRGPHWSLEEIEGE
ncbi:MAG: hydrogenase/urease maturation nickel metallochaperone HypA [bacterium]|nr:hydrogenase/urease maturation nickel metallochaperone HypA [bacterium]